MTMSRAIEVRGRIVGQGREPLVCTPLVARTRDELVSELDFVLARRPDLIEWRADYFAGLDDLSQVCELSHRLAAQAGATPLIFTIRSTREGGQPVSLNDEEVADLCVAVCETGSMGLTDFEISAPREHLVRVRAAARSSKTRLILSYHNFNETPCAAALYSKFVEARELGGDVAKVAVMPVGVEDVLTLLNATLEARRALEIPLISMSMGPYGVLTRVAGWMFGSSVTFAAGRASSAPGQLQIEDLGPILDVLRGSCQGG
jgi:3-dehydroquinate dehydratase-1